MDYDKNPPVEVSRYREMQKAMPGVEALYRLMLAQLEVALPEGGHVLVVGAGGGREVEALSNSTVPFRIMGVDPSGEMLDIARWYADQSARNDDAKLIQGTTADIKTPAEGFDAATSLLVMHFLAADDSENGKAAYLRAIRERLKPGALLIHADVSFDDEKELGAISPIFQRHAILSDLDGEQMAAGADMMATLPIISPARTETLLEENGFKKPSLFFKSLWYHAWVAKAV